MNTKLLIPAILFIILSLLVIIGNTVSTLKGDWGIWSVNHWAAVIFHAITMIVGLYLFNGAVKKKEED